VSAIEVVDATLGVAAGRFKTVLSGRLLRISMHAHCADVSTSGFAGFSTTGGRQPDEPAAMSLRERFSPQLGRPRKWPVALQGSFTSAA